MDKINIKREAKIGLFALIVIVCFYMGINFLKGKDIFTKDITYYAYYDQVNGLQKSSPVLMRGVKVGIVNSIDFDPSENSEKVIVSLLVKHTVGIPSDSYASLFSTNFMGSKAIEIHPGSSTTLLQKGDSIPTRIHSDLFESMGQNIGTTMDEIDIAIKQLSTTLETVNTVLNENADPLKGTVANLESVSGRIDRLLAQEDDHIREILAGMGSLAENLRNNSDRIDHIIANVDGICDTLRQADLYGVVNNLALTIGEINNLIAGINRGQGSVGQLFTSSELHYSLERAMNRLASLLEDLEQHPERYVQFSLFGRRDKTKNK